MIQSFLTGLVQVFLVAYQTRQISRSAPIWQIGLVGSLISGVWVCNIRAVTNSWLDALCYVAGATIGSMAAMKIKVGAAKLSDKGGAKEPNLKTEITTNKP